MMAPPDDTPVTDDSEFLNNFIATLELTITHVHERGRALGLPTDDAQFYFVTSVPAVDRLVRVLHGLKAQSHYIDLLKTNFQRECQDINKILAALGIANARTEGGSLKVAAIINTVKDITAHRHIEG